MRVMMGVRIISTAYVSPTIQNKVTQRIELNPWELQFLLVGPIQKGLLFRNPTPPPERGLIDHLKTSLSRTLDLFYPLAGRLGTIVNGDDTTSFFLNCNGAGVQFVHAAADGVTVRDILDPVYVPELVSSFFPLNGTPNHHGVSQPVLAVQVTELVDGIFIGCTMNHVVADGSSFWHFFNSWSENCRGADGLSQPPVLNRWVAPGVHLPIRIPLSALVNGCSPSSPCREGVFYFRKEKIAGLKAKANAETSSNQISSLQVLLAHVWRSVIRNRRLPEDEKTSFMFLIGMRPRVHPPLPQQYFGVTVQTGFVTMKAGELLDLGLGHAALQMNKMVSTYTRADAATHFFESWAKNPKLPSMTGPLGNTALINSSSPRFNVHGNDFGWGRPVAVRSGPGNKFNGKITIFPGAEEGSIEVQASLFLETIEAMMEDAEFMDAVTI